MGRGLVQLFKENKIMLCKEVVIVREGENMYVSGGHGSFLTEKNELCEKLKQYCEILFM